jgi:hypothetical protein
MALVLKDRVKESSTTAGTGSITLGGAFPGYQTFNAVIANGSTVYYAIQNTKAGDDDEWEVGLGTFTSPATLARTTVLSSSNSGSLVDFSASPDLEVFITQPAEEAVYLNQATGKVEVGGNGTNVVTFTEINTTNLTANTVTLTAGTISTNAANATDITNKSYVDGLFSTGITYHAPVLVESPTALTATYNQPGGAGNGVGATLTNSGANVALSIDGVSLSNTARVLVYQQSNAVQNGVYTVTNPGAPDAPGPGAAWVLTRATDADTYGVGDPNKLGQGDAFFVTSGNTGAGETYILNTVGTITFGATNLTFAQISSAQIYAAGTGLNLSNLTFSIANTTVVSGLYGDSANVSVIEVNAQGQLTSAANSAINVSNITVGTLSNDRTTANTSNGANTIVLRDANGSFNANVVTATTGNFTSITANAAGLTDINASNISSGTISNARTTGDTANSASTIVLRDATGNFGSNVITASLFSGDGSGINAINASNISSGTVANARTTAASANGASTIVLRDSSGSFSAGDITANSISGNGVSLSAINASNITSGTIANARTTAASANGASTIVLRGASGEFAAGDIVGASANIAGNTYLAVSSGNVGIGTTSPNDTLEVAGANAFIRVNRTGAEPGISFRYSNSGTNRGDIAVTSGGAMYFTAGGSTERMRIASDGNVGIGTSSPTQKLSVAAAAALMDITSTTGTNFNGLELKNTSGSFYIGQDSSAGGFYGAGAYGRALYSTGAYPMVFFTNATERMRITSAGNVGIGTSTPAGALDIKGDNAYLRVEQTVTTSSTQIVAKNPVSNFYFALDNNSGGTFGVANAGAIWLDSNNPIIFATNNAQRMRIAASGGVSIGNTTDAGATNLLVTGTVTGSSFIASSDERLKENWTGLSADFIEKLSQVKNGSFNRIGNDTRESGVTAQSLQKVMPEAVVEGADGYLSVNYGGAALVAAIELAKVVEELRKEVAELRAELKAK